MPDSTAGAPRERGVHFPVTGTARRSSLTGRNVLADAVRAAAPQVAAEIERVREWRRGYAGALRRVTEVEATSAAAALTVARDGLAAARRRFVYVDEQGDLPLEEAVGKDPSLNLETVTVRGQGARERELAVPYRGELLRGDALARQLDDWVARGVAEPSFAAAIREVQTHPEWLALDGYTVALLGAGAEMGPLAPLSRWGARLMAVDLPSPPVWSRILPVVRAGCGTVALPQYPSGEDGDLVTRVGADIGVDTAAVRAWLDVADGPLVVGNYVYADGGVFARLAVAADAIVADLLARRDDVALSALCTPTDVFAVPPEAVQMARERYAAGWRAPARRTLAGLSGARLFAPNYPDGSAADVPGAAGFADALVTQQGPNYALAKRVQRWRATAARAAGVRAAAHVAPPTRTRSVTKNRLLAAAYRGASRFGVEVFEPATAQTLMAALLVYDLRCPAALAAPATPLDHPHELFQEAANHGGLWRQPYHPRTVLPVAALLGLAGG